jgi:hypothetical protein
MKIIKRIFEIFTNSKIIFPLLSIIFIYSLFNEYQSPREYQRESMLKNEVKQRIKIANFLFSNKNKQEIISYLEKEFNVKIKNTFYENLKFDYPENLSQFVNSEITLIPSQNSSQQNVLRHLPHYPLNYWARAIAAKEKAKKPCEIVKVLNKYIYNSVIYDRDKSISTETSDYHNLIFGLKRKTGRCFDYARYLEEFCRSIGIPARLILYKYKGKSGGHVIVEVYLTDKGKWLIFDPTLSDYFSDDEPFNSLKDYKKKRYIKSFDYEREVGL